jgi:uncharacterized protein (DUF2147 family)
MIKINSILLYSFIACHAYAQTCVGKWTTIDDKTGKKKAIVELYKENHKLFGKIIYLYPREGREPNPKCTRCTDDRKDQALEGLQIVRNLSWDGEEWEDGSILDPENGKVYDLKLWIEKNNPDKLYVRGYIGPFFRTQNWFREKEK